MSDSNCTPTKVCTKCLRELPATTEHYYFHAHGKYQLTSRCRECMKQYGKEHPREYIPKPYVSTPEKRERARIKESKRRADHREEYNEKARERRKQKGDIINQQERAWYAKNPAKKKNSRRRWAKEHPEEVKYYRKVRRDRKRNAVGYYKAADIRKKYKAQKGRCWWCGKKLGESYHIDHWIPLSKGGTNWPENLVISCQFCNASKGNKLPNEFNGRLL